MRASNGTYINDELIEQIVHVPDLRPIDNGFFVITGHTKKRISKDIESLNPFLKELTKYGAGLRRIDGERLKFEYTPIEKQQGARDYCIVEINGLTKTGKLSKHPVKVAFFVDEWLFGEINYTADGKIGRAHIVEWLHKKRSHGTLMRECGTVCYSATLVLDGDRLVLNAIDRTKTEGDYNIEKVYRRKARAK